MKLNLIAPKRNSNEKDYWDTKFSSLLFGLKEHACIFLSLPTIAALTPDDMEIKITDENIEEIDFEESIDIVGITCHTSLAPRTYEIADEFRKRGVTVVLGGVHVSVLPYEAIKHADAVVIGEAENVWSKLIHDFKQGCLKRFYQSAEKPCLDNQPMPRYDLIKNDNYVFHIIQTTRGCPYNCEFCSVKVMYGNRYRYKPVEKVIKEIETLLSIQNKLIFFTDDNFGVSKERTKKLLKELIPLNISYNVQISLDVAEDEELLELFAQSRCRKFLIGFESLSEDNLRQMHKAKCNKVEDYAKHIEKIQAYGIEVHGSFIFGYDSDNETVFENTVNFINETNISSPILNILTPLPGTSLFKRFRNENRILHTDWSKYDTSYVCFVPKRMSPEALLNGSIWARQQIYSYEAIFKRLRYLWNLWNKNNLRLWDRITPMIGSLQSNDVAYSYPQAIHPDEFNKLNNK